MGKAYLDINKPRRRQFSARTRKPTGCIVIHTTESVMDTVGPDTGAENVAKFIQNRSDPGSYHRLVDSDSIVKLVRFGNQAYGDGTGSNSYAIHIAFACSTTDWAKMTKIERRAFLRQGVKAAVEAAKWLKNQHGVVVPASRITKAQSAAGRAGFISHGERDPGRRSDPGANFPWVEYLDMFEKAAYPKKAVAVKKVSRWKKAQPHRRSLERLEKRLKRDGFPKSAAILKGVRITLRFNGKK